MHKFYVAVGNWLFYLLLPLMRLLIRRTTRAYVVLHDGSNVLLVKNWLGDGTWALPGGGLAAGETARQAVVREIREELGVELAADKLHFLSAGRAAAHRLGHHYELHATLLSPQATIRRSKLELTEVRWFSVDELQSVDTTAEIMTTLQTVLIAAK